MNRPDSSVPFAVTRSVSNGVGRIVFSVPPHHALPAAALLELAKCLEAAAHDSQVRVIVLQSTGDRTFCAGASFDELLELHDETSATAFFSAFARVINACRTNPKLILGRIQGKAIGGGVGLAAAVDYALATTEAAIRLSELAIGIGPFVVGPAIERKIGPAAFAQLAIDAATFRPASWAREKGLYAEVHESIEALDAAVGALTEKLAAASPEAMTALKRVFWEGTDHWDSLLTERAAISGRLVLTEPAQQAMLAFKKGAR
jgi:methylglutaconyl-CoA hydratase